MQNIWKREPHKNNNDNDDKNTLKKMIGWTRRVFVKADKFDLAPTQSLLLVWGGAALDMHHHPCRHRNV